MPPDQLVNYRRRAGAVGFASAAAQGVARYGPRLARAAYNVARRYAPRVQRYLQRARNQRNMRGEVRRNMSRTRTRMRTKTYRGVRRSPGSMAHMAIRKPTRNFTSSRDFKLSLRDLNDLLFPKLKETYQVAQDEVVWDANQQGVVEHITLSRSKVQEMWTKVHSTDVASVSMSGVTTNVGMSSLMQICGGMTKYTLVNSSNHTIEVTHYILKPRRRINVGNVVLECWERDLLQDNTLGNAVTPTNSERTMNTYGTPLIESSNRMSYVKWNWRVVGKKSYIMNPGDTIVCSVKTDPYLYDYGYEAMAANAQTDAYAADYGGYSRSSVFICKSQTVVNAAGTQIAHGSGKVAFAEEATFYWRAGQKVKRFQTVNHGSLDTIADADQYHFNEQTEAENVYAEA